MGNIVRAAVVVVCVLSAALILAHGRTVVTDYDQQPLPIARVYPSSATDDLDRTPGTFVEVWVEVTVDRFGRPWSAQVVSAYDTDSFGQVVVSREIRQSALQAAKQWRFQPALKDGQAVPATTMISFKFATF